MKLLCTSILLAGIIACNSKEPKVSSIEMIKSEEIQKIYFDGLMAVTNNSIQPEIRKDSLAFLILPLEASCPSCRKKAIDSIIKHEHDLKERHFIVISTNSDYKTINAYFEDRKGTLPQILNRLFLDTANNAAFLKLYDMKPTMYYTFGGKAYKKVGAIPNTVKDDLREFFSGHRRKIHNKKT